MALIKKKSPKLSEVIDLVINESTIAKQIAEFVVTEVMIEVAEGRQFSLIKCPCGCGIDKSGTAITHEMLARLHKIDRAIKLQTADLLERRLNAQIAGHISEENKKYTDEMMRPGILKRIFKGKNQ